MQNREAAVFFYGIRERPDHFLPRLFPSLREFPRTAFVPDAVMPSCSSPASANAAQQAHSAGIVHIGRGKPPTGFKSASTGVFAEISSNSSIVSGTPVSRAIASRCSTALVEPPVAATDAIALCSDSASDDLLRANIVLQQLHHQLAAIERALSLRGSIAGISFAPIGEIPRNVSAVAMVFAVN